MARSLSIPFQLVAGHPVLDFINTLDNRFDPARIKDLIPTYQELLRFTTESGLITDRQARKLKRLHASPEITPAQRSQSLTHAIQLREHLSAVTYALLGSEHGQPPVAQHVPQPLPQASLLALETAFKQAAAHRQLIPSKPVSPLEWKLKGISRDLNSPLWLLAQSANDLLTSPQITQLRACASPACRWLFLDTSKNHKRRWCDMRICGNRSKARLFQARKSNLI